MPCQRCGGFIYDEEDGRGPRCLMCGRSEEDGPTLEELDRMGVTYFRDSHWESDGHGRLSALEAEGFHSGPRGGHSQSEMGRRVRP